MVARAITMYMILMVCLQVVQSVSWDCAYECARRCSDSENPQCIRQCESSCPPQPQQALHHCKLGCTASLCAGLHDMKGLNSCLGACSKSCTASLRD